MKINDEVMIGAAVVGVIGLTWWLVERKAAASNPPVGSSATQNGVLLQPGATTIAPAKGSTVLFDLPAGASWTGGTSIQVESQGVTLSGNESYSFIATDDAVYTVNWVGADNLLKVTTINVVPS